MTAGTGIPTTFAVAELGELSAESEPRGVVRDRLGHAARAREAAERDDDGREVEVGDQHAVHQAPAEPARRARSTIPTAIDWWSTFDHLAEDSHREHGNRADREVDEA